MGRYYGPRSSRYPTPMPIRHKSIGEIYYKSRTKPEYREQREPDRYGEFERGYRPAEGRRIEHSPESRPIDLYDKSEPKESPEHPTSQSEGDSIEERASKIITREQLQDLYDQTEGQSPRELPSIELGGEKYSVDGRLHEVRKPDLSDTKPFDYFPSEPELEAAKMVAGTIEEAHKEDGGEQRQKRRDGWYESLDDGIGHL